MDRPPAEGWESQTFTYRPASEWDLGLYFVDVPAAKRYANKTIEALMWLGEHGTPG